MNSLAPFSDHPLQQPAAQISADTALKIAARPTEAANDSAVDLQVEPEDNDTHNPLWTVVIGSALLFAAMAALMAFG